MLLFLWKLRGDKRADRLLLRKTTFRYVKPKLKKLLDADLEKSAVFPNTSWEVFLSPVTYISTARGH